MAPLPTVTRPSPPALALALALVVVGVSANVTACRKVPLIEQQGSFTAANAHWFGNENVAYVFFSVAEDPALLEQAFWEMRYTLKTPAGGTEIHDWARIDFAAGVHEHSVESCGARRICGSYSFVTDKPLDSMTVRVNYNPDASLFLELEASVQAHPAGTDASAHSAFLYGVWDVTNEHVQTRVHHNFGAPGDAEILRYGMRRRFRIREPALVATTADEIQTARAQGSDFLFTPAFCAPAAAGAVSAEFVGEKSWLPPRFDPAGGERGVCFTGEFLDKKGARLFLGSGYAQKNPELGPSSYTFLTPLRKAIEMPIVLRYCQDDPQADQVTDADFFTYQKYILGLPDRPVDLCFRVGKEAEFKTAFETLMVERLTLVKQESSDGRDFVFVVLFHQNLSKEFRRFHQIIAESLSAQIASEAANVSPRLVGGFVYDSRTDFRPTAAQRKLLLWCPQAITPEELIFDPQPAGLNENCSVTPTTNLDLTVINFITPMGAFPSLADYQKYVDKYGDRGLAKNPSVGFSSVPTGANTRQEAGKQVTFHDGERLVLSDGQVIRLCLDKGGAEILGNLRFRLDDMPAEQESFTIVEAAALWMSDSAAGEYRVGTAWDFPYIGAVSYTSALTGNVVSVIPFQRSFKNREALGDPKWGIDRWNIGDYMQVCRRFCDHPFFDEGGTYQIHAPWKEKEGASCPAAIHPTFDAASAGKETPA